MTPEAQRKSIAEACGYKKVECPLSSLGGGSPSHPESMTYWQDECWGGDTIGLPEYLNDLNACAEMEKALTSNQRVTYLEWLDHVTKHIRPRVQVWQATAAQRCEAFLRTIGKWEDV